jgi:hypothetical protein
MESRMGGSCAREETICPQIKVFTLVAIGVSTCYQL